MQPVVQAASLILPGAREIFTTEWSFRKQRRVLLHLKPNVQDASTFGLFKNFSATFSVRHAADSYEVPTSNREIHGTSARTAKAQTDDH